RMGVAAPLRQRAAEVMAQPRGALPHDDHFHVRISCPPEMTTGADRCIEDPTFLPPSRLTHHTAAHIAHPAHGSSPHAPAPPAAPPPAPPSQPPTREPSSGPATPPSTAPSPAADDTMPASAIKPATPAGPVDDVDGVLGDK